jgi:methionine synthase I (cobalamin-dependent)
VTPSAAAGELVRAGACVIGANCGLGIDAYVPVCAALAAATDRPVWIKPNAGLPTIVDGQAVYAVTAEQFASHVPTLIAAGARFIGGCCGSTPAFVAALHRQLTRQQQTPSP